MKVLFAGGGTGGHINPALAIASIIQSHQPDAEFLFAGTPNGMEAKLVPQSGYQLATIKVAGFQRKLTMKNIRRNAQAAWYLATSGKRAKQIVNEFQPDIAIGTGGYVAGPVIRMAAKMGDENIGGQGSLQHGLALFCFYFFSVNGNLHSSAPDSAVCIL